MRGTTTRQSIDGEPYQGIYHQGEWKAFSFSNIDATDFIIYKKVVTALKLLTLTTDQSRLTIRGDFQDYNVIEYDTVFDLKNGNVVNEKIYYSSGRIISSGSERTNTNINQTIETRTCYLVFIGC